VIPRQISARVSDPHAMADPDPVPFLPAPPTTEVVYTTLPGQDGPAFLRRAEAVELAEVHAAVRECATWGALRARLTDARWAQVVMGLRALGDDVVVPADDAPLEGIPGYDDGDWPGWPAGRMLGWVPESVQALGVRETTVFNGPGLFFRDADRIAVLQAFEREGFRCVHDRPLVCAASGYAASGYADD
jgi:hypothetical protein